MFLFPSWSQCPELLLVCYTSVSAMLGIAWPWCGRSINTHWMRKSPNNYVSPWMFGLSPKGAVLSEAPSSFPVQQKIQSLLLRHLSLVKEKQLNACKWHIEGKNQGYTKSNEGVRGCKIIVQIMSGKALWGKGVLRQVLKEVELRGEKNTFLFNILSQCEP